MKDVVSDSEGEIFASTSGKLLSQARTRLASTGLARPPCPPARRSDRSRRGFACSPRAAGAEARRPVVPPATRVAWRDTAMDALHWEGIVAMRRRDAPASSRAMTPAGRGGRARSPGHSQGRPAAGMDVVHSTCTTTPVGFAAFSRAAAPTALPPPDPGACPCAAACIAGWPPPRTRARPASRAVRRAARLRPRARAGRPSPCRLR